MKTGSKKFKKFERERRATVRSEEARPTTVEPTVVELLAAGHKPAACAMLEEGVWVTGKYYPRLSLARARRIAKNQKKSHRAASG